MKRSTKGLVFGVVLLAASACGKTTREYFVGERGPQGEPGQSIEGPAGQDGQDATPVTVVQLCPGTTTYPTTFVEVAFCIGGKLYATYSANGGFSTEIPPGNYSSNAIGSSCNFTVLPNCAIQ